MQERVGPRTTQRPETAGDDIVNVRSLSMSYGNVRALEDVSFKVAKREIFAYLGPNGAGKTTTINILCGLLARDAGEVSICGFDVRRDPVAVKQRIGVVPEESNLYPELTSRRNLLYLGELYGLSRARRKRRASELLDAFGLADKASTPFRALSRGMKRRLTIAAALIHEPEIVFLDEPTAGLDVPGARALRALIMTMNRDGTTVFLTTHNLAEAEALCDRVLILVNGRILAVGTAAELRHRVSETRTLSVVFSNEVPEEDLRSACPSIRAGTLRHVHAGGKWRLDVGITHKAIGELLSFAESRKLQILEMATTSATLEDVFLSVIEGNRDAAEMEAES